MLRLAPTIKGLGAIIGIILGAALTVSPATAMSIQYSFTGDVDHVHSQLSSTFNTSQLMSGSMTVDTADTNGSSTVGNYNITSFSLDIGNYHATMGTSGQVEIRNGLPGLDRFNVTVNAPDGPNVNFLGPRIFQIQLRAPGGPGGVGSAFDSDALPTLMPPPSIAAFTNFNRWRLIFGPDGNGKVVRGELTSLTAVPLPAAVILFGAGLIALVGLGAGSWRQKKNTSV